MKLYGIPNCDTVKKAKTWLSGQVHDFEWHDYKKSGISAPLLEAWITQVGWETLLNRQGTTWRKLDDATKASIDNKEAAIALMIMQTSIIKRPVLDNNGTITVGFKPEVYASLFRD
ncbi:ArsC family reductase [Iodobacter fluviatilis]|uniref:Arsenate reductase n=1 Tax=Iodobacter fluviatilis TaxID=537 RepID=A0A377Q699_9NEIS|nr:ArsC family reductase [Iodobacter fluviatilis]TCU89436.1 arsenate reductase [Iodobacter fluviatilis]STQ90806.1 putative reductase [Iodobacter fluviatilis]